MAAEDQFFPPDVTQPEGALATAGDFAKTAGAGAANVGSNLAAASRYFFEAGGQPDGIKLSSGVQQMFQAMAGGAEDSINPATKKLLAAELTSSEFWDHPLLGAALKTTGMAPAVVAMAIPGGIFADAIGATAAVAAAGGAINAGTGLDEFYKKLDAASDADLKEQSPKYRTLREMMDEGPARQRFMREAQGWAPALNAVIGAGVGVVGPAATAARGLARGAENAVLGAGERGALGSGAIGAAEGAIGNAVQGGSSELLNQQASVEANFQKEMDLARAANAALEGGALGAVVGGAVGMVAGGHAKAPSPKAVDRVTRELNRADEVTPIATTEPAPPQVKNGTTGTPAQPVETAQVGNPQNSPTRSDRDGAKVPVKPKKGESTGVEVVQPSGPDAAIAAAVAANDTTKPVAGVEKPGETRSPAINQLDTGMNVPEQPATIAAQTEQLGTTARKAVMYPTGSPVPPKSPQGMKRVKTARGVFDYDPAQTTPKEIRELSKLGRENELLGLGPVSKPEAMARVAGGETPAAVVERAPDGTEVKAAVGTTETAPAQVAALDATKTPGNVVAVEQPANVLQMRSGNEPPRTGRILPNLTQTAETVPLSDFNRNAVVETKEPSGQHADKKRDAEKARRLEVSKKIVDENLPQEHEANHLKNPEARDAVIRRARNMVDTAEKEGVKIQQQIKKSVKGDALSDDPSVQILRAAKDLVRTADKRKQGREITEATGRFAQDEALIRGGFSDEVIARRREEGDAKLKRRPATGDLEHVVGGGETPESKLSSKEEAVTSEGNEAEPRVVEATPEATAKAAQDEITTRTTASKREMVLDDGTEKVGDVTRAKAASTGRTLSAEEKAAIAERMGLKLSPAKIKNDKPTPQQEAHRVNTSPTEAQKIAGNYKKGHRNVEGLDFSIENPKGSTRRGRDGDREWSVKMPADYGYLRRTLGADGDHVDAYDGRSGKRFFIVDQLDHQTGAFDEHKVMMRFKDEAAAREAYHAAFSDGKGEQRLGYIHEVTPAELKEWLNKGDTQQPHLNHIVGDMDRVNFDASPGRPGKQVKVEGIGYVDVERSSNAATELQALDFSKLPGVEGVLSRFFSSRLVKLAGEVEVHYLTPENMKKILLHARESDPAPEGLHSATPGGNSQVFISTKMKDGVGFDTRGHTLLHELVHAVTVREIDKMPGVSTAIHRLMKITNDYFSENQTAVDLKYSPPVPGKEGYTFRPLDYGLSNAKEFIAEAFSNPHFQNFLSEIPLDADTARHLGFEKRSMSIWDVFRGYVKQTIEKITGKLPNFDSVLDGIMRVGEHVTAVHEIDRPSAPRGEPRQEAMAPVRMAREMVEEATSGVKRILEHGSMQGPERAPVALKLRTFDNIAQIADHFFEKAKNPVRAIHEAVEAMRATGDRIFRQSEPIVRKLVDLRAADPEQFAQFTSLLHDATVANVHPDVPLSDVRNAHLGKDALKGVWSKSEHPDLAKRYDALSGEFKETWHEVVKHYTDTQNKMSLGIIQNQILKLLGIEDASLAKRIHEGTLDDADRAVLGSNLDVIERASELSKIEGPYVPLMRRGDHVVKGDYKITSPGNAKKVGDNEFEFNTRKEAEEYAKASPLQASIKKIWIDPKTGERLGADELDSVDRYRVQVQNRHVEFVQGRRAAEARAAELAKDPDFDVHKVVPRALEPNARQGAELSTALSSLVKKLEHSDAYKAATPTQRATLRQAIEEAALASHGSTRVSSRALPRRGVKGYSEDLVQNTVDYGASSSRYLAKLEHGTELENGLKEMKEQLDRDHSKTGQYARTSISNEVRSRVELDNGYQAGGKFSPIVKRAMSLSFIDKLGSPAYSVINAMQPGMVTMPYLAGKHGIGRSFAALGKAYSDVGAAGIVGSGLRETGRRLAGRRGPEDFLATVRSRLSGDERAMLDEHVRVGTVDPGAGMEIAELVRDTKGLSGKLDTGLSYLEGVTREMPRAIEAINRTVTALAAYRLERARGGTHEQALTYSKDAVNSTQFNYSPTNSPAIFNHPLAKIALQFKKYGQGMYQLIGTQIAHAVKNESPGDRAAAVKTLITLAGAHMAMAGALGLPTEPFKYLLMGAHALGLTKTSWSDVEDKIRKAAEGVLGVTGGEVFSRGLPRLVNVDLSRMGLDSVTSFGEPRSMKDVDVKSWLFDSVAGPVVALGGDWIKGLNQAANGDFEKAAENLIPLKAASDSLRAYRQATEGKKSASGRQTLAPYGVGEAGLRVLGFGSGREAESGAANAAFYRQSTAAKDARTELMSGWVQAKPEGKMKAMAAITKFNQGKGDDEKITMKDLTAKLKREQKAASEGTRGILANKRDKRFLEEGAVYNTR